MHTKKKNRKETYTAGNNKTKTQFYFLKKGFMSLYNFKLDKLYKTKKNISLLKNKYFSWDHKVNLIRNYVNIRIHPNNTIITLSDLNGNVIYNISAGKLGLQSSKKNYRVIYNMVLNALFKYLKNEKKRRNILFKIVAPRTIKRRVVKRLKYFIRSKFSNKFELVRKIPFNGCRPPKIKRKKRKGLRIFKPSI